jgi:hypothetical protein
VAAVHLSISIRLYFAHLDFADKCVRIKFGQFEALIRFFLAFRGADSKLSTALSTGFVDKDASMQAEDHVPGGHSRPA